VFLKRMHPEARKARPRTMRLRRGEVRPSLPPGMTPHDIFVHPPEHADKQEKEQEIAQVVGAHPSVLQGGGFNPLPDVRGEERADHEKSGNPVEIFWRNRLVDTGQQPGNQPVPWRLPRIVRSEEECVGKAQDACAFIGHSRIKKIFFGKEGHVYPVVACRVGACADTMARHGCTARKGVAAESFSPPSAGTCPPP